MRPKGTPIVVGALVVGACTAAFTIPGRLSRSVHPQSKLPITLPGPDGDKTTLHNGWKISPAGRSLKINDMPLGGSYSPDGKLFAIANCGWGTHNLHIFDVATEKVVAKVPIAKAWNGIVWTSNDRILVSAGISNPVHDINVIERKDGQWEASTGIKLVGNEAKSTAISGMAIDRATGNLFVLNQGDGHLYVLDKEGKPLSRSQVGDHPVECVLTDDAKTLYVANWGGAEIAKIDVAQPAGPVIVAKMKTGEHPNDLALAKDGRIFVSCGNADQVTILDTPSGRTLETVKTSLTPLAPAGSTPVALALSPDATRLFVANSDNNSVTVLDISKRGESRVKGMIPTGWYPSAVSITPDGKRLIVGAGKGSGTKPNAGAVGDDPRTRRNGFTYIGSQLNGMLSFVDVPTDQKLAEYTKTVYANSPYRDYQITRAESREKTAIPTKIGEASPIKYVLYIIKENRTYDQVFGDIKKGNGDPNLTLFGRDVTPNHHALAEQFVLLDNLYCNGEVSEDGHPWSTSAYATDFTQRHWVLGYSGKGKMGNAGLSVRDPQSGYLWEAAGRKGLSFRSYGEYRGHPTLKDHESDEFIGKGAPGNAPPGRDYQKADIFIREFQAYEKKGTIPHFMVMSLGEDHTNGTRAGSYSPKAMVASNDQAVGKIVEAISKSSVWKEFAIFVIEDDAQNGPDHIDSHRTIGLVISPYTKRAHLDSTMYTTASMLRTMELILGLPPLTQHDAAATPMFHSFTNRADLSGYTNLPPQYDLMEKNKSTAYGAKQSAKMDFSEYDRIDEQALNRILWHSIKGSQTPYPGSVRRALPLSDGRLIHTKPSARRDADE